MRDYDKHKIKFTNWYDWETIEIQFAPDSDVEDWKNVMKSIMIFATFPADSLEFLDDEED